MTEFKSKTAIITGGTGGLGRMVSLALARAGVVCHVTYVVEAERNELAHAAAQSCDVQFHRVDVTDAAEVEGFYSHLDGLGRPLDFLVNLVGGFEMAPIEQTDPQVWQRMLAMNATSVFLNCREAVMRMKPRKQGRIITVSAKAALETPAKMTAYVASKSAVLAMTQSLARELKDDGITVNSILPSTIDTPANRQAMPKADPARWVTPQQIAEAILFLLSERAAAITGVAMPLYGRS